MDIWGTGLHWGSPYQFALIGAVVQNFFIWSQPHFLRER
ncbi:hypothetical protein thalar_02810 [Litoreibacter arenae DSM 19593]|uniref:Uncharacterized protein n=1 Tax=Litoreibacter arenae DSM 19593 TaxID=1123360 RepID=S9Q6Y0_9RHOB|nr:hypothetical protein thalar_02810 [Litoreibacter arenae DSM 19593]